MSSQNNHHQNVVTLLEQCVRLRKRYRELQNKLDCLSNSYSLSDIDDEEKIEEEINFLTSYEKTLIDQVTVIINEHNLQNIPSLEEMTHKGL